MEAEEAAIALRDAIATLPPRQREALELTKLQEMSVADAATRSGQTQGALKVNVHRALRALQLRFATGAPGHGPESGPRREVAPDSGRGSRRGSGRDE